MNAPQQVSSRRSLIVIAVLPRSCRDRNLRHELWFHGSSDLSLEFSKPPRLKCRNPAQRGIRERSARTKGGVRPTENRKSQGCGCRGENIDAFVWAGGARNRIVSKSVGSAALISGGCLIASSLPRSLAPSVPRQLLEAGPRPLRGPFA